MKLTIFSRLVIGYLTIFLLVIAMSGYAIFQITQFNRITQSVLMSEDRIIDYSQKLTDNLLSQIRFEKKFLVTKDTALYDQFLLFKTDFEQFLGEMDSLSSSHHSKDSVNAIKTNYQIYLDLFNDEAKFLKSNQKYSEKWYKQEKDGITETILVELENLKNKSHQNTFNKIKKLDKLGVDARKLAIIITAIFLVLGISLSMLINRSITKPISIMKKQTREIANGNFEGNLKIYSPPEIGELAEAFNLMCNKLKDLDKLKSDFFSSMSHELRTPLTSIKEGTGLLLDGIGGEITEKQKKLLTILAEESRRLIELVNSLLDLSKMEAGMMTYNFEQASLAPLINKAMTEIAPLVESKKINLELEISKELPPLKMDSERILQALRNLIGNAVKFTPEGGRIMISSRSTNKRVEVAVTDTGPGIPRKDLNTIFDKFQQSSLRDSLRFKGTGLGLAIVKYIITSHGGEIWVESQPKQGSTFIFALPAW